MPGISRRNLNMLFDWGEDTEREIMQRAHAISLDIRLWIRDAQERMVQVDGDGKGDVDDYTSDGLTIVMSSVTMTMTLIQVTDTIEI
jgi:hypothetical protein